MSAPTSSAPHPARAAVGAALVVVLAVVVAAVPATGLVTLPLARAGLLWPAYGAAAALGILSLLSTRWWAVPTVALLVAFWAVFAAWAPRALQVAPDARPAGAEVTALTACALIVAAVVGLSRGRTAGLAAIRVGLTVGLVSTCGIAVWEVVTQQHLFVTAQRPWPFVDRTVVAATFQNPNNFGAALLGMSAGALAWRAFARTAVVRHALAACVVVAWVVVAFTQSRSAAAGVVVLLGVEAWRVLAHRGPGLREALARHRGRTAGGAAALAVLVVAAFTVPPLSARNPVRRMIDAVFLPETATSDTLRIDLARAAVRYWRESGWLGTGAGSYEPIMWNDPASGVGKKTNLHNAFLELASQYGVVVALPLVALLVAIVVAAARRGPHLPGSPADRRRRAVRAEVWGQLTGYVALGCTASSALPIQMWWVMLAAATACTWWLHRDAQHPVPGEAT